MFSLWTWWIWSIKKYIEIHKYTCLSNDRVIVKFLEIFPVFLRLCQHSEVQNTSWFQILCWKFFSFMRLCLNLEIMKKLVWDSKKTDLLLTHTEKNCNISAYFGCNLKLLNTILCCTIQYLNWPNIRTTFSLYFHFTLLLCPIPLISPFFNLSSTRKKSQPNGKFSLCGTHWHLEECRTEKSKQASKCGSIVRAITLG